MQCLAMPTPGERSSNNPRADRRLLYTVEPRKLPSYWTEAHQIYVRCICTITALNASINIAILQRVFKCKRNFRQIQVQNYKNKNANSRVTVPNFIRRRGIISMSLLMRAFRWLYCNPFWNPITKKNGGINHCWF